MCHTLWHRLDLDFVSDDWYTGLLSAYTGGRCWSVDRRTSQLRGAQNERGGNCRNEGMTEMDRARRLS
jgi:hypothetical protein